MWTLCVRIYSACKRTNLFAKVTEWATVLSCRHTSKLAQFTESCSSININIYSVLTKHWPSQQLPFTAKNRKYLNVYVQSQCECVIIVRYPSSKGFISWSQQCPKHPLRQASFLRLDAASVTARSERLQFLRNVSTTIFTVKWAKLAKLGHTEAAVKETAQHSRRQRTERGSDTRFETSVTMEDATNQSEWLFVSYISAISLYTWHPTVFKQTVLKCHTFVPKRHQPNNIGSNAFKK
jgi:hypothetical protein